MRSAEHEDVEELGGRGEIGPLQEGALQDLLDGLGVEGDAGNRGFERRRPEIEQACRARADDQNAAFDGVGADLAVEHLPGRQIALLGLRGEPDPHLAVRLGRHLEIADLDADDAGLLAERLLAARAGGLHDIGRSALGEPQHVGGKGGIERVADPDHHGHAADDLVVLGDPVERACSLRLVLQFFQARRSARVIRARTASGRRRHGRSPPWSRGWTFLAARR